MSDSTMLLNRALALRRNRRHAAQAISAAAGGLLLLKASMSQGGLSASAQDSDDDDSSGQGRGRGRGRGRGGDDDNSGPGNAEDREDDLEQVAEIPAGSLEIRIVGDDAGDFVPGELTVDIGQSVTFVNVHSDEHTATGSGFDTGIIPDEGGIATVVLDTPGTFPYACLIHPEMTGVISVRGADGVVPETQTASQDVPADAAPVRIANLAFDPAELTVSTGTTVAWTNDDTVPHTVTSVDGLFDSGIFDPGASFSFTFDQPGTFSYVCQLHPQMQGIVIAEGEAVAGASPVAEPAADAAAATPAANVLSDATVSIVDFAFEPATLKVSAGTTVAWTNEGLAPHTVTGDFADSGVIDPGQVFSHTFDTDGTFDYVCAIHPEMAGTINVGPSSVGVATQAPTSGAVAESPSGVWMIELTPDDESVLGGQQTLLTFHGDGAVRVEFAAAPGDGQPTTVLSSGQGEWVVRDDTCEVAVVALMIDGDRRFAGTVTLTGSGQFSPDGQSLDGTFEFAAISASGQLLGQGTGTLRGEPVRLDP